MLTIKQSIGIPMGIDPVPFLGSLFLYSYEEEYLLSVISFDKIKASCFPSMKCFSDNLCVMNYGD